MSVLITSQSLDHITFRPLHVVTSRARDRYHRVHGVGSRRVGLLVRESEGVALQQVTQSRVFEGLPVALGALALSTVCAGAALRTAERVGRGVRDTGCGE